jgi:hypothetical protein
MYVHHKNPDSLPGFEPGTSGFVVGPQTTRPPGRQKKEIQTFFTNITHKDTQNITLLVLLNGSHIKINNNTVVCVYRRDETGIQP